MNFYLLFLFSVRELLFVISVFCPMNFYLLFLFSVRELLFVISVFCPWTFISYFCFLSRDVLLVFLPKPSPVREGRQTSQFRSVFVPAVRTDTAGDSETMRNLSISIRRGDSDSQVRLRLSFSSFLLLKICPRAPTRYGSDDHRINSIQITVLSRRKFIIQKTGFTPLGTLEYHDDLWPALTKG